MAKTTKMKVVSNDGAEFLSEVTKPLTSIDGWSNGVTGMGFIGRDKGESTAWRPGPILSYQTLDSMGRGDGFSRIIVDTVVDDAMRSGWVVNFTGDDDTDITPEESHELNEKLQKWYKDTKLKSRISQHLKQSRQYGGAVLALGVRDGQDPSMPLDVDKITGFDWMRSHDRHQAQQSMQVNDDPTSPGFGFAEAYTLHAATIQSGDRDETLLDTWVHNSRVWRTDGVFLSERVRQQNEGWGDSVLQVCSEQLGNRSSVMKSARTVVQEWVQGVYKIKNLAGIIGANGEATVRARFSIMDRLRSAWQAIIVDADAEDYQRIATTASGMPEVLDRFGMDLAAVARMPMTKLFGLSPGGFGTGEAEGDDWDDVVTSYQTDDVGPLLEYVHTLLLATPEFADFPKNFSIAFNSLELTSPLEDADVRLKTSQRDALDISSGVVGADEVAMSRYGGATYSVETVLDTKGREMDARLEEQGIAPESSEPFVAGQIASMLDILERVKTGTLPKKSALVALGVAFPTMSPEAAAGMVNPIEITGPIEAPGQRPFGAPKPAVAAPAKPVEEGI
jgi:phage-related protein (TIGR01555 family)